MNSRVLVVALLALAGSGCLLPCDPISSAPQSLCHRADAGAIVPDASFILEGETFSFGGTCQVNVDAGLIDLQVTGGSDGTCGSTGNGVRAASETVRCTLPPLPAGTYTFSSSPGTLSVSESADSGLPSCR